VDETYTGAPCVWDRHDGACGGGGVRTIKRRQEKEHWGSDKKEVNLRRKNLGGGSFNESLGGETRVVLTARRRRENHTSAHRPSILRPSR